MTAATKICDPRVKDMAAGLQKQLDADPDDEEGVTPDGLEYLEEFLQDLTENILDRHNMRCPLVQASDTGEIVLVWREPSDSLYVDVHLPSRQAEHILVDRHYNTESGRHSLKNEGWKTLGRKISAWKKSTGTRNSTG